MELDLPVQPGNELASERMMFAAGTDYHAQLEAYGGCDQDFASCAGGGVKPRRLVELDGCASP